MGGNTISGAGSMTHVVCWGHLDLIYQVKAGKLVCVCMRVCVCVCVCVHTT